MANLVDLSHEIEHGMVTYRGLPSPTISDWLSRDASTARPIDEHVTRMWLAPAPSAESTCPTSRFAVAGGQQP